MNDAVKVAEADKDGRHDRSVEVSISTTAGFYPERGSDKVPSTQDVRIQLEKADKKLGIKDTTGWIATVSGPHGKRQIDPGKSYLDNGLSGEVEIDWGPSEGGGGA